MTQKTISPFANHAENEQRMWADIYEAVRVQDCNPAMTIERFMQDPWGNLKACGQESAFDCLSNGYKPLLPAQAAASKRIQGAWDAEQARPALRLVHSR